MKKRLIVLLSIICLSICCCPILNKNYTVSAVNIQQSIVEKVSFESKTLIIEGEFDSSSYENVTKLFDGTTIIKFDNAEETESAYYKLIQNSNITVYIDEYESASISADYPPYTMTEDWGYSAISADVYNEYLEDYNVGDGEEVVVVVIDSGINTSHELLKNRILKDGSGRYVGMAATNDGVKVQTKYTYSGYEFEDDNGHGTHVAGIIANSTPSNVKILPIKLIGHNREFILSTSDIRTLFAKIGEYSTQYNIVAVNMSWGGYNFAPSMEAALISAINTNLIEENIVPIAAAGNERKNADSHFPSCLDNVVCVSSLKDTGAEIIFDTSYSNYGSSVDISAPGTYIYSSWISDTNSAGRSKYAYCDGTSMASPYVTAAFTLLTMNPHDINEMTVDYLKNKLYSMSIDLGTLGVDQLYGHGMVSLKDFNGGISFSADDTTYTYDGNYHNVNVAVSGVTNHSIQYRIDGVADYYSNINNIVFNNAFKNVTRSALRVYFKISTTDSGYSDTFGSAYLTINPKQLTISIDSKSSVYGDNIASLTWRIKTGSLASGENSNSLGVVLNTVANSSTDVGSYDISGRWNNSNYNIIFEKGLYTITPRSITAIIGNASSMYGESLNLASVSVDVDLVSGDTLDDLNLVFSVNGVNSTSFVGIYYDCINATYSNDNYNITFDKGDYTIVKRSVTINTHQTSVYGEDINIDNALFSIATGSLGVVGADDLGIRFTVIGINNRSNVGIYDSVIGMTFTNTNYQVNEGTFVYEITARPINITIHDRECEYGDIVADNDNLYTVNVSDIVNGDDLAIDLTVQLINNIPGRYSITGVSRNNNYAVRFTNGTLTINKRRIAITIYQEGEYSSDIVLDNTEYTLDTGSLASFDTDLRLMLETTATRTSEIGEYDITIRSSNNYYDITLNSGVYKIIARNLTVRIDDKTSEYGYNIANLTYKIYDDGDIVNERDLINFDIDLSTTATKESNVSNTPIIGINNETRRYNINFENGVYTITKRNITIKIRDKQSQYGFDIVELGYDITSGSIAVKDNKSDLNINIYTSATNRSNVNEYPIQGIFDNGNYNITFVNGKYTITKRKITIITQQHSEFGKPIVLDNNNFTVIDGGSVIYGDNLGIEFSTTATNESTYGTYPISMTYSNNNYDITLKTGEYKIVGRIIRVSIGNKSAIYGEAITLNDVVCTVLDAGITLEELNIKLSSTATTKKDVGIYDITAESQNVNYSLDYNPGKFEIVQRRIKISTYQSGMYGETPSLDNTNFAVEEGSIIAGDSLDIEFTTNATELSIVGDYDIEIVACANANYIVEIKDDLGIYTITKRPITIMINNQSNQYGEIIDYSSLSYSVTSYIQAIEGDDLDLRYTISLPQLNDAGHYNKGSYTISAVANNDNYQVSVINGIYSITKREMVLDIDDYQAIYGGSYDVGSITYNISSGSLARGENVNVLNLEFITLGGINGSTPVGRYENKLKGYYSSANYSLIINNGAYVINPRNLVISTTQSCEYGQTPRLNNTTYEIVEGSVVNGDDLGLIFASDVQTNSPIGDYHIWLEDYSNKNYDIRLNNGIYTITNKTIIIIVNSAHSIYGDPISNITYRLKYGYTLFAEDRLEDLNIVITTAATSLSPVNIDGYEIFATYNNDNYNVLFEFGKYSIKPRALSVVIDNCSSIYGEVPVELTYHIDTGYHLVNRDSIDDLNISLSCDVDNNSPVRNTGYPIVATYDNANYNITFNDAKYIVSAREIYIKTEQQGEYGKVPMLSDEYEILSGNIIGDDVLGLTFKTNANKSSPIGTYDILINKCTNNNYNVVLDMGIFNVLPCSLVLEIYDNQSVYGEAITNIKYRLKSGYVLASGDTLADLNISISTPATSISVVKDEGYPIIISSNNSNYDLDFENLVYTILPKEITVVLENNSSKYSHEINPIKFKMASFYTLVGDDSLDDLNISPTTTATSYSNVISEGYPITASYDNDNYNITFVDAVYMILPLDVTIVIENQSGVYGDEVNLDQSRYTIINANVTKEELDCRLYTNANNSSSVGDYIIYAKSNNPNYSIVEENGSFTVNKRRVTIQLNDQEIKRFFEYNVAQDEYSIIDGAVVNNDDLMIEIKADAYWFSWMGEYKLTATSNNTNYEVNIEDGCAIVKVSTTDIILVVVAGLSVIAIIMKVISTIKKKKRQSKGLLDSYSDWLNRK